MKLTVMIFLALLQLTTTAFAGDRDDYDQQVANRASVASAEEADAVLLQHSRVGVLSKDAAEYGDLIERRATFEKQRKEFNETGKVVLLQKSNTKGKLSLVAEKELTGIEAENELLYQLTTIDARMHDLEKELKTYRAKNPNTLPEIAFFENPRLTEEELLETQASEAAPRKIALENALKSAELRSRVWGAAKVAFGGLVVFSAYQLLKSDSLQISSSSSSVNSDLVAPAQVHKQEDPIPQSQPKTATVITAKAVSD
jgi:hypothetical protein